MSTSYPPLNALRAFEAAARRLSFTKAAEDLDVTPGAISQQIKILEDFVGQPLFRRLGRAVELTDSARAATNAPAFTARACVSFGGAILCVQVAGTTDGAVSGQAPSCANLDRRGHEPR
jgi:hypothetical protein